MSFQSEIMGAVDIAVGEAAHKAEETWRKSPSLNAAAMLTSTSKRTGYDNVSAEMTFETHRQQIPRVKRDMYGVGGKTIAAHPAKTRKAASTSDLEQKTGNALETGFIQGFEAQMGILRNL